MTTFPGSPKLIKGGIVIADPASAAVRGVIPLQYNPDTLTRSLQVQSIGEGGGDRSEALRLTAPPVETVSLEAEIDATDLMESGRDPNLQYGIAPQLAQIEALIYPTSRQLSEVDRLAASGTLEIAPIQAPLTLFVWSQTRVMPVRLTELSVTEEAFDPLLNPLRAKVKLGMRVLSVHDVGFQARAGGLYMAYQREKERLAALRSGALSALGIRSIS